MCFDDKCDLKKKSPGNSKWSFVALVAEFAVHGVRYMVILILIIAANEMTRLVQNSKF